MRKKPNLRSNGKTRHPAQVEKALKRKSEKEAKKRAAAGEWSKEDGPVVFEKIPWFDWAEEA